MAFHLVAREGGFTRAAEKRKVSKAMLSKQVKRLEASLRAKLFHRTTRQIHLTESGAALFAHSSRIFDLAQEAGRAVKATTEHSAIRISMPISFGEFFGPGFLSEMQKSLPGARFELDLANENRDFKKDEVDFAIRATADHHPDLVARHLGVLRDVICAPPKLAGTLRDPKKLASAECILHSQQNEWNNWTLIKEKRDIRVTVGGPYATNQYPTMRALCVAGLGVARIPFYIVKDDIAAGRLVELFSDYRIHTHPLYLVYLKSEYASRRHAFARDKILDWFQGQKGIFA